MHYDATGAYEMIDLASPQYRSLWLSHPVLGDASYDAFERVPGNPIFRGAPPYEWPVNGALFQDPRSGYLYAYISEYPRGYWPAGPCRALRSRDGGVSWEDLGLVLSGSPEVFDGDGRQAGAALDVSVVYDGGLYHMVYGWAKPDNSDGGIAYAWAERPEGPFVRALEPIHAESRQPLLLGVYKRVYACSLVKRERDWLILADMSTPRNAGGTWAVVAFTAPQASGPYDGPHLLLYPQSRTFLPCPVEAYGNYVDGEYVYLPATSVAANRSFQIIFRAKVEEAHRPEAWEVYQYGSVWHDEPVEHEAKGIWGQTFCGFVDGSRRLRVLFPSKDSHDVGTINLASRPLDRPYRQGFVLSAPNGPSMTIVQRNFSEFSLEAHLRSSGTKRIICNHNAPLGPDRPVGAEGHPHPLSLADCTEFALHAQGWALTRISEEGARQTLAEGGSPRCAGLDVDVLCIAQKAGELALSVNGREIWRGPVAPTSGSIGFVADAGTILQVEHLLISTLGAPCSKWLLPTEAIMGSGSLGEVWMRQEGACFRYGFGFVAAQVGATAKWNYRGRGFRLWGPRGPTLGVGSLYVDGQYVGDVLQHGEADERSRLLFEALDLPLGFHAVSWVCEKGKLGCDSLEFFPD